MYKIVKKKIKNIFLRSKILSLKISNTFNKQIGVNTKETRDKKVIVSLTSYPERFNVVYLTIETLLNQTIKPDKIILWLANEEVNQIPEKLLQLQGRGLQISIVDENLKSYNKLIHAIESFPQQLIITVDDDVLYPSNFIEKLYAKYLQYPDCIIAYRCSIMRKESYNKLAPYLTWNLAMNINKPSLKLFFKGVGGVLYPPNSLYKDITNRNIFLNLCPLGDDIWFKAMSLLCKTKVMQVYKNCVKFPLITNSQNAALWKINVQQGKNDEQLKNVFDYYDLYKLIDDEE